MPAKKINPIEEHFEKGILGIGVIVLLYTLIAYTISSPTSVLIETKQARPGQAYKIVLEKAKSLDAQAAQQHWPELTPPKAKTTSAELQLKGLPEVKPLPPIVKMNKEIKKPEIAIFNITKKYDIPKVLAPQKITVIQGRSTLDLSNDTELQKFLKTSEAESDISWVTVAGEIDLEKQRKILKNLPDQIEKEPIFIRVELQRAQIDANGKTGKWEDVPVLYGDQLILPPDKPLKVNSMSELRQIRNDLFTHMEMFEGQALQPVFPTVKAGKEWTEPLLPGEKPKSVKPKMPRRKPVPVKPTRTRNLRPGGRGGMEGFGGARGRGGRLGGGAAMGRGRGGRAIGGGGGGGGGRARGRALGGRGGRTRIARRPALGAGVRGRQRGAAPFGGVMPAPGEGGFGGPMGHGPGEMPPGMGPMPGMPGVAGGVGRQIAPKQVTVKKAAEFKKTEKTIKIWAFDLTPKPGKTYIYRMRVVMYNPLAGYKPYLKDPNYNLVVGIPGEWSAYTKPVTIEKTMYLFVTDITDDGKGARITIYKWYKGWLCKETFSVYPGQSIGYTKITRAYDEQPDGFHELRPEVDFNTGAILLQVEANKNVLVREPVSKTGEFDLRTEKATVIIYRNANSNLAEQDTSNIIFDRNYKRCKSIQKEQLMKLRKSTVIRYKK